MKRSPLRYSVIALSLALSVSCASLSPVQAAEKNAWNPMTWFSDSDAESAEAQRQAEMAQREAERARQEAEKAATRAQEAAEAAQRAAEKAAGKRGTENAQETQSFSSRGMDTRPAVEAGAPTSPALIPTTTTTQEPVTRTEGEKSLWNPMSWFGGKEEKPVVEEVKTAPLQPQAATDRNQSEPEASKAGDTETQSEASRQATEEQAGAQTAPDGSQQSNRQTEEHRQSRWQTDNQPSSGQQAQNQQPAEQQAKWQPERQADSQPETGAKSGGWNMLGLFSRDKDQPRAERKPERGFEAQPTNPALALEPQLKQKAILVETEKGNIAFELYPDEAPLTVANFVKLVNSGFYNRYNMKFHRVIPGFVIQTGDPTGTGAGGSKERITLEVKNKLSHNVKGVVAMARGGDPNSATSQFYITLAPQATLDGKYAIFGKVISGIDVVDKIEQGDMLYGVRLVESSTITRDPAPEKKHFFSSLLPGGKSQ